MAKLLDGLVMPSDDHMIYTDANGFTSTQATITKLPPRFLQLLHVPAYALIILPDCLFTRFSIFTMIHSKKLGQVCATQVDTKAIKMEESSDNLGGRQISLGVNLILLKI